MIYLLCLLVGATFGGSMVAVAAAAGRADAANADRLYCDQMDALMANEWELREAAERVERGAA